MRGIILYYCVGPVHFRNLELIAHEMPEWAFRLTYEPSPWMSKPQQGSSRPVDRVVLRGDRIPEALWSGPVRALIFSTVQPRRVPLALLRGALARDLPTIAIEETHQIALSQGRINNYCLPVDHVLVASAYEREGLMEAGVPGRRIELTGWPFYPGRIGKTEPDRARLAKQRLGLDPDRPVATLTLTAMNELGETPATRRRQLTLAAQGLPPSYQLVIKPHPIEGLGTMKRFVLDCAPRARLIDGSLRIDEVLEATDCLLNRGTSQVCLEALLRKIPVVILDVGLQTPFHHVTQGLIAKQPGDVEKILATLTVDHDPMRAYEAFISVHLPYSPRDARTLTCRRIAEIAEQGLIDSDRARQWFDLAMYQAWKSDRQIALALLAQERMRETHLPINELRRLIQCQATRDDLQKLQGAGGNGFRSHVLRCLWIDQITQRQASPMPADLAWMHDFPPPVNTLAFLSHISQWVDLLLRTAHVHEAQTLAQRLNLECSYLPGIAGLVRAISRYHHGLRGRTSYSLHRIARQVHASVASVARKGMALRQLTRAGSVNA